MIRIVKSETPLEDIKAQPNVTETPTHQAENSTSGAGNTKLVISYIVAEISN